MSENGGIYTAGKNFTLPPALTAWTNSTSGPALQRTLKQFDEPNMRNLCESSNTIKYAPQHFRTQDPKMLLCKKLFQTLHPRLSCLLISFEWHMVCFMMSFIKQHLLRGRLSTRYFSVFWNVAGFLSSLLNRAEYKVTKTLTIRCANDGWSP